jgi:hypothetical protein
MHLLLALSLSILAAPAAAPHGTVAAPPHHQTQSWARQAEPDSSLLERLAGRWVLRGTIDGQSVTHDVVARLVLAGGYLQLHEVSREKDAAGAPAYEAMVYITFDPATGQYQCLWLDNTGVADFSALVIGRARASGDSIPFLFQMGPAGAFHTTFSYSRDTDSWRWRMDSESNGKLEPFARVTLTRS